MDKKVAIIGATGLVGRMFMRILEERDFPVSELHLYATEKSSAEQLKFKGRFYPVRALTTDSIEVCDLALFSAGAETAKKWAGVFRDKGAVVVDNSSAFRMEPEVPLVVPEVNPEAITKHKGIIANPNCSTIGIVMALYPLHLNYGLKSMVVTSMQSVSGAGQKAVDELENELRGKGFDPSVFDGHKIAGNCLPKIGDFSDSGETAEESKFRDESRKIMNIPDLQVSATAVRVPVMVGHSMSVLAQFVKPVDKAGAIEALKSAPGVKLFPAAEAYPTALDAAGSDLTFVGRIRTVEGFENALNLWIVVDNLRKGAATNAVQIAELVFKKAAQQ